MYDIIGDVHGYASLLKKMLLQIGYTKTENGYAHPSRKAIFVGDFVNRGPEIRKAIRIIRKMVENGNALAVLGNHEINLINYYLRNKNGLLVGKLPRNQDLAVFKTISQFFEKAEELKSHLKWMRQLPFFLEFEGIRIVHACWSDEAVNTIKMASSEGRSRKSIFKELDKNSKSELSKSILTITRGIDYKMPGDLKIINNKGVSPQTFRLKWWKDPVGKTFEEMSFDSKFVLPEYEIPKQIAPQIIPYSENEPVVIFGHYCRHEGPFVVAPNLCCVDSCVAGTKVLTAYRWNGEKTIEVKNLVQVKNNKLIQVSVL